MTVEVILPPPLVTVVAVSAAPGVAVVPLGATVINYGGTAAFDFTQASPLQTWVITHGLGRRPIVEVLSAGGMEVIADVLHLSINQVNINFAEPTAGSARLI